MKIVVLGAGTWGIALSRMLFNIGHSVTVWSVIPSELVDLSATRKHKNLPGMILPSGIIYDENIESAIRNQDIVLFAVPSVFIRPTAVSAAPYIDPKQIVVNVSKGIEAETLFSMTEVIEDVLRKEGVSPLPAICAFSGPTHAEEVALDQLTTIVAACEKVEVAELIQKEFSNDNLRVYTNEDVKGVELCGALKNIIALAAGILTGLSFGDNARAALITRGIKEMTDLGVRMGCFEQTFSGLAGIGDLIVTATSQHSRNYRAGVLIGKGMTAEQACKEVGMVVEGINALPAAVRLSVLYQVDMPIFDAVDQIINKNVRPNEILQKMMHRDLKSELPKTGVELVFDRQLVKSNSRNRGGGMKRVITYGTFDLLHYGHINLLRRAKALGDYLIVAISTDEFNWNEKHKKCYFTYEQRKALVEAVRYVDLVIPEESWGQKKSDMHEYHIDTFVIGDDWKGGFDFLKEEGVEVVYLPRTPEISSSQMKKDLHESESSFEESKTSHEDIQTNPE